MIRVPLVVTGNRILDALSASERDDIVAISNRVDLRLHDVLSMPDECFTHVYFPLDCVLSTTVVTNEGDEVEITTVGLEGFDPLVVLLGADRATYRTVCQVAGAAYRLPVANFVEALEGYPALRERASRFGQASLQFMGQSIACNRLHPLMARCARWLLTTHDRVRGDELRLTQEYLAVMLGVRRPAVSVAQQTLQQSGLIAYRRGSITVLDRAGLEATSCECYRIVANAFERLLGLPD